MGQETGLTMVPLDYKPKEEPEMQVGLRIMDDGSDYPIMNGSNGVDTLRGADTLRGGDTTLKAPANSTTGNNMICKGQSVMWGSGCNVGGQSAM